MKRGLLASALSFAFLVGAAVPVAAHVQVRPTTAAPEDAVLFEILVPNEEQKPTVAVELAIPAGVIPFSYESTPGWRRTLVKNDDESVRSVVWRGSLPAEGFARFSFLASTPARDGDIAWKAIQTYQGGEKVRWIGAPGSETPAAVTTVSKTTPKQNAGGEGTSGGGATSTGPAASDTGDSDDSGDGSDTTARWLAGAALAAALASLAISIRRRRNRLPS